MPTLTAVNVATWAVALVATLGVITRPWRVAEAVWAVLGATALTASGLIPWSAALRAVGRGTDVYLFLTGMMLLAELAREEGLFDWLAALAARRAHGSATRLFALIYVVGIAVTTLLSNDATAVVLTPAVFAVARAARAEPLPYLFICAMIANAASFVLPISNPANLVVFGHGMPPLPNWIERFALPSALSIAATFAVLRWTQRRHLQGPIAAEIELPRLEAAGRHVGYGILATGAVLLLASAFGVDLGWPTCLAAGLTLGVIAIGKRTMPWTTIKGVSWGVLPLVAGLFVLVEGLNRTGVLRALSGGLEAAAGHSVQATTMGAGVLVAIACNLVNNLPAGLLVGSAVQAAQVPDAVTSALLVGVDLGPNLSVTGSLATILWLVALRREGIEVGAGSFLRLGLVVMPPALVLALGSLALVG